MTSYRDILSDACRTGLDPVFGDLGFTCRRGLRWRRDSIEVRVVFDSKSGDPYRGGAFTLEFERSDNGQFETKLAGRVRVDQLLDVSQRQWFLGLRNAVAARLPRPDGVFLEAIPESLRDEYLKVFAPATQLEPRPWMRFGDARDAREWCALLGELMPVLVDRAGRVAPHVLLLGESLTW
ncbi:MAG: hypothetical protein QM804_13095 [Propionicimonas sp.]